LVCRAVAGNPNASPGALDRASGDKAIWVRREIARNPHASAQTWNTLAEEPDQDIRIAVAGHSGTAPQTLQRLAADTSPAMAKTLLGNRNTPGAVRAVLFLERQA